MRRGLIVGVDAGASKTAAIVCGPSGQLLGFSVGGPGSWEAVGLDAAIASIDSAVAEALEHARATRQDVDAAAYGLAGLDWPDDRRRLEKAIEGLGLAGERTVVNDWEVALWAGCERGVGCVSCAGTGTIAGGRSAGGQTFRTFALRWGEWGGAIDLVDGALSAIARAHYRVGPSTKLERLFLEALDVVSVEELFRGASRAGLASGGGLAPLVLQAAAGGDDAAIAIAAEAGRRLALTVAGVATRLGMVCDEPLTVVRSGSVHGAGNATLDETFAATLRERAPNATALLLSAPPAAGAAILAAMSASSDPLKAAPAFRRELLSDLGSERRHAPVT